MKKRIPSQLAALAAVALIPMALLFTGCKQESSSVASNGADTSPAAWMLASDPGGAISVTDAKATVKAGDKVVVRARIGGRKDAMNDEGAVFVVMDLAIPYCGELRAEGCPTPWDYCCETPESKMANAATIQIVDADGEPIDDDIRGAGLKELDEVVLVGTVGPRASEEVLTIFATGVYRAES